jgi:hypothetical protein
MDKIEKIWEGNFGPFYISKHGTLKLTVRDKDGNEFEKTVAMEEAMSIDHGVMFKFTDKWGMSKGVGAVVGEAIKK